MRCYLRFQSASGFGGESGLGLRIWRKDWAYWSDTSSLQSKTVLYRWKNVVMEFLFVFKKPLSRNVTSFSGSERTSGNAKILKVVSLKFKILSNLQPSTFPSKSSIFTGKSCGFEQKCHLQSCQYYTNEKMLICSLELNLTALLIVFSPDGRSSVHHIDSHLTDVLTWTTITCVWLYVYVHRFLATVSKLIPRKDNKTTSQHATSFYVLQRSGDNSKLSPSKKFFQKDTLYPTLWTMTKISTCISSLIKSKDTWTVLIQWCT